MRMTRLFLIATGIVLSLWAADGGTAPAAAQTGQPVKLTLTNTAGQKVNIYVANADGSSPRFVGAMAVGARNVLPAQAGQMIIFSLDRTPFQRVVTTTAAAQNIRIALAANDAELPPAIAPSPQGTNQAAAAANGFVWQFAKTQDGPPGASLVYGLPETDAVQLFATCRQDRPNVTIILGSDVASAAAGSALQLNIRGQSFQKQYRASAEVPASGEGLTGFIFDVALNDPLWNAFAAESSVSYGLKQLRDRLPLAGSSLPLSKFISSCSSLATGVVATAPSAAPKTANKAAAKSCVTLNGKRSKQGGRKISVVIVNQTKEYRALYWIDPKGNSVSMGALNAGDSMPMNTFDGHIFEFTDGPGNCIEKMTAAAVASEMNITVPSPGFGPE